MRSKHILFSLFILLHFSVSAQTQLLPIPAKEAFDYLNKIRANPGNYSKELGVNLNRVKPSIALQWNDTLAKEAERKAQEMATKDYFAHVDKKGYGMNYYVNKAGYRLPDFWLENKKNNQIESLGANSEGPSGFIKQLIKDEGVPDNGHRRHLLSIDEFYKSNTNIGIGIAYNPKSTYKYYCCILIAPNPK